MNRPPNATSEVIHRNPDYETTEVTFEDTATGGWETYPNQGSTARKPPARRRCS